MCASSADFGGEVERILSMIDGVILLVDASEGPMAQTKFVLSKALAAGKKSIVVLNKVDREGHRAEEVESEIFDLYFSLTQDERLLEYPLMYASARQGWVSDSLKVIPGTNGVVPLLDMIVKHVPPATISTDSDAPFALAVNTIGSDNHLGRIVTGKVEAGKVSLGDPVKVLSRDGETLQAQGKVTKLFFLEGLTRVDVEHAYAGEIISMAGTDMAGVADTVCSPDVEVPVKTIPLSPPVISMTFGPNDSPIAGREGTRHTSSMIKERLQKEVENNVTLSLRPSSDPEAVDVQGRGELQIGILVESMRREGFELTVSPPKVLAIKGEDGILREPMEEVIVDVDVEYQGMVIESMSHRNGELLEMKEFGNKMRLVFITPSRSLLGFRNEIIGGTRGNATINSAFSRYDEIDMSSYVSRKQGKIVCLETGKTTGYSLMSVEERGILFVGVGEEVYEGKYEFCV
jgi:GTP-binding protein